MVDRQRLSVQAVGMVSAVGVTAESSCAAIRARISRYSEIAFHDSEGEAIVGAPAPEATGGRFGIPRIIAMLEGAFRDCVESYQRRWSTRHNPVSVIIAVGDSSRPDYNSDVANRAIAALHDRWPWLAMESSGVLSHGKTGIFDALSAARDLVRDRDCIILAADSLINARALRWLEEHRRLKTESNSDGVIPGEAAAALWVASAHEGRPSLAHIDGIGFASEPSANDPTRANTALGLAEALRGALADSGLSFRDIDFRVGGMTGERWEFMEASVAFSRVMRERKSRFDLWLPAEMLGDVGTALGACMLATTAYGFIKRYAPGKRAVVFQSSTSAHRAACIISADCAHPDV